MGRGAIPQGALVVSGGDGEAIQAWIGSLDLSTAGLGLTAGQPLALIQASETAAEAARCQAWFDQQWQTLSADTPAPRQVLRFAP